MSTLKKKTLNLAVGAALGVAVAAPASADSLLAPLVVSVPGIQTFFQVKVQGQGTPDARFTTTSDLHYYWFQKGSWISDLRLNSDGWSNDHQDACEKSNARGIVSPWDMVFQSLTTTNPIGPGQPGPGPINPPTDFDQSQARFVTGPFVGFMILDDEVDGVSVGFNPAQPNVPFPGQEGQFSGSAYVVDFLQNIILDYKLLNNHKTSRSGDFSVGFISKKTVDLQWWPVGANFTEWLVLAVGANMTQDDTNVPSSLINWPGSVVLNQLPADAAGNGDTRVPFGGQVGVYDNDENVLSGGRDVTINCMALIDRSHFMTTNQQANTIYGGWTRKNLTPILDVGSDTVTSANGAIVYRFETGINSFGGQPEVWGFPFPNPGANPGLVNSWRNPAGGGSSEPSFVDWSAFQIETSGHLGGITKHPNRPY